MSSLRFLRFDFGSSSVKAYKQTDTKLELLATQSFHFKQLYQETHAVPTALIEQAIKFIQQLHKKHPRSLIRIYATAFFRSLTAKEQQSLIDFVFSQTGAYFTIVSGELETTYLETALAGRCTIADPVLLINIGGGSTELVVKQRTKTLGRYQLEWGVGQLLAEFPQVNEPYSGYELTDVVQSLSKLLPEIDQKPRAALYSGGELTFMRRMEYPLVPNRLFKDADHPVMLAIDDFTDSNERLFGDYSLEELYRRMPENPKWMDGARLCSALAQAIVTRYAIPTIIPSDVNLMHGVVRQEWSKVVISGSFRKHLAQISALKKQLTEKDITVLSPRFTKARNPGAEFVTFAGEENATPLQLERHHLQAIEEADALIVCNPEGYVGASALIEIGYAHSLRKRIVFTEQPSEFMLTTLPAEVGLPW